MPITKITIQNFKGIADEVEIPLKPITLLFGANSAGKSTILQSLLYLRELLERSNPDADRLIGSGDSIDLGGFKQMVHQHDLDREIKIGVTLSVDDDGLPVYPVSIPWSDESDFMSDLAQNGLSGITEISVSLSVAWDEKFEIPWVKEYEVEINGEILAAVEGEVGYEAHLSYFNHEHAIFAAQFSYDAIEPGELNPMAEVLFRAINDLRLEDGPEGLVDRKISVNRNNTVVPEWQRPLTLIEYGDLEELLEKRYVEFILSHLIVGAGEIVLRELRHIRYIGPIREIPDRNFSPQKSPGTSRWATGLAAWDWLYGKGVDRKSLDLPLIKSLGLGCYFERKWLVELEEWSPIFNTIASAASDGGAWIEGEEGEAMEKEVQQADKKVKLELVSGDLRVPVAPCDVGVGVSQVMPVVVATMVPGYSILMVEQPELHIHPRVQCNLADVLALQAIRNRERLQILETHSEHIMLRLLRRIREHSEGELGIGDPALNPDDVSVLYVENEGSQVVITPLAVTEDGDFSNAWPNGFFEERANELF